MSEQAVEKEPEDATIAPAEGAEGSEAAPAKSGGKMKLILMIAVPLLLIIGGGAGFVFFTEKGRSMVGLSHAKEAPHPPENIIYFSLPEMMVNLIPTGKKNHFLRLVVKLELPDAAATKTMDLVQPRIVDQFQTYLRELRVDDIEGSAGLQRLREELLKRVNIVTTPIVIKEVLFEVMLIQ